MIKFFGLIRQKLIVEKKIGKYFIYAIGEIFLVVIGILIALQVNNWNQARMNKDLELDLLREIKDGLEGDLIDIEGNLNNHLKIMESQDIIINWLSSNKPYNDSLAIHFANVANGSSLIANSGPYENLKQMGIRLITNDSLRNQIMKVYDYDFQAYKINNGFYGSMQMFIIHNVNSKYFQSTEPLGKMIPISTNTIKADNEYSYQVRTIRNYNDFFIKINILPAKEGAIHTIQMIEAELQNRMNM